MFWMGSINYSGRLRFTSCAAGFFCVPTSVALTVTAYQHIDYSISPSTPQQKAEQRG